MTAVQPIRVVEPTDVLWARVGAWLLDGVLAVVPAVAVAVLLGWPGGVVGGILVGLAVGAANGVGLQGATGATVGKLVAGVRVVDAEGSPCTTHQALVRTLAWAVDGLPGVPLVGYAAAFGDPLGQRLGDRWAGTYVVARRYVGHDPHTMAFPTDGSAPYRLEQRAAYLASSVVNHPPGARAVDPAAADRHPVPGATAAAPVGSSRPTPVAALGPAAPDPLLDRLSGTYRRWDEVHRSWLVFDEHTRRWEPEQRPVPH